MTGIYFDSMASNLTHRFLFSLTRLYATAPDTDSSSEDGKPSRLLQMFNRHRAGSIKRLQSVQNTEAHLVLPFKRQMC